MLRKLDLALIIGGNTSISHLIYSLLSILNTIISFNETYGSQDVNPLFDGLHLHKLEANKNNIPIINNWLSFEDFYNNYLFSSSPVILRGFINHWRCFNDHNWNDIHFWKKNYGRRTIPVELGFDYRSTQWEPVLITINQFIDKYILNINNDNHEIGYFAQSQIFEWIPSLRSDIAVPDYIGDNEEIINIWFVSCNLFIILIVEY